MSKELPYFQFEPAQYLSGDIQLCSLEAQGVFINLLAIYWQRDCQLTLDQAKRRLKSDSFKELISENIIKLDDNDIPSAKEYRGRIDMLKLENDIVV